MFGLLSLVFFIIVAIRDFSTPSPAHQIGLLAVAFALLVLEVLFPYGPFFGGRRGVVRRE